MNVFCQVSLFEKIAISCVEGKYQITKQRCRTCTTENVTQKCGYSSLCYLCPSATWLFVLMTVSTANGERGDRPPSYCALVSSLKDTLQQNLKKKKCLTQKLIGSKEV